MAHSYPMYPQAKGSSLIILLIYLVFSAYFINFPFNIIKVPSGIESINQWIVFLGGILLLLGAINHYRVGRHPKY